MNKADKTACNAGTVANLLLVVGGLNWGLIGLFDVNLVDWAFGFIGGLPRVIYVLVGVAAVYVAYTLVQTQQNNQHKSSN